MTSDDTQARRWRCSSATRAARPGAILIKQEKVPCLTNNDALAVAKDDACALQTSRTASGVQLHCNDLLKRW